MQDTWDCHGCGEPTKHFVEGYCEHCHDARQRELDLHNARFDIWESMTDTQRARAIKDACR